MPHCPVCKMYLAEEEAVANKEYQEMIYYFDKSECLDMFERAPEKYLEKIEDEMKDQ